MGEDGVRNKPVEEGKSGGRITPLKVLVTSDFHGSITAFHKAASKAEEEQVDLIIVCGDITHFGTVRAARSLLSLLMEPRLPVFFVPGNCDPPSLPSIGVEGARCIHLTHEHMGDYTFAGIGGGTISPFDTPFEMTEEELRELLERNLSELTVDERLVLVSHMPPANTSVDVTYSGRHIGSSSIREFIERMKPIIVFCGHVHEAPGIDRIDGTMVVNPGPAKDGRCAIANLNEDCEVILDHL